MGNARSVSMRASDEFLKAVRDLAWRRRIPIADVTREAVTIAFGNEPEIAEVLAAESGQQDVQLDSDVPEAERAAS